jgi:hypothetical protein
MKLVAQTNFPRLQPLLEIVGGLLQKGLIGEEILWTFLTHGVQPLRQRELAVGTCPGPSCLICPSFSRLGGIEAHARAQETLIPKDPVRQESCHACIEWLQLQRLKRWVEDDLELKCS